LQRLYDAVLHGDAKTAVEVTKAIVGAGIPVLGHIGLTPQTASSKGGFKVQGKSAEAAAATEAAATDDAATKSASATDAGAAGTAPAAERSRSSFRPIQVHSSCRLAVRNCTGSCFHCGLFKVRCPGSLRRRRTGR
jgi:hypothetical protein